MAIKDLFTSFKLFEKTKRDLTQEIRDGEKIIQDSEAKIKELEAGAISKADFIAAVERNIQTRRAAILDKREKHFSHMLATGEAGKQSMFNHCFSENGNETWSGLISCLPCFDFREREEIMLLFHADSMLATARDIINSVPDNDWPKVTNTRGAIIVMDEIDSYRKLIEMKEKNIAEIKAEAKRLGIYLTPRTAADDIDYEIRG